MAEGKKEKLVRFLDEKVFDPILETPETRYDTKREKEMLKHVKNATESEKKRFHDEYGSAEEVKTNFRRDLYSEPAKKIDRELDELGLPSLPGVQDEFMELCGKLGV